MVDRHGLRVSRFGCPLQHSGRDFGVGVMHRVQGDALLDHDTRERTALANRREALFTQHELSTEDDADPFHALSQQLGSSSFT